MEYEFTKAIKNALRDIYGNKSELIYSNPILFVAKILRLFR